MNVSALVFLLFLSCSYADKQVTFDSDGMFTADDTPHKKKFIITDTMIKDVLSLNPRNMYPCNERNMEAYGKICVFDPHHKVFVIKEECPSPSVCIETEPLPDRMGCKQIKLTGNKRIERYKEVTCIDGIKVSERISYFVLFGEETIAVMISLYLILIEIIMVSTPLIISGFFYGVLILLLFAAARSAINILRSKKRKETKFDDDDGL